MPLKDEILAADDLAIHKEHVPEWKLDVWIRIMGGKTRSRLVRRFTKARGQDQSDTLYAQLLVNTLCDKAGKRIFDESDIDELSEKSGVVLDRLFGLASDLNGLSEKSVEDAAKNSENSQKNDSGSS